MNEEKSRQLWKIIQEAGDYLQGQLPDHPNHPKGRNPYAHVAICVKSKFKQSYKDIENGISDLRNVLKGTNTKEVKKKTQTLIQASMKLGEAVQKS